jgi:tetratricopeptide (TPR) repeat protein
MNAGGWPGFARAGLLALAALAALDSLAAPPSLAAPAAGRAPAAKKLQPVPRVDVAGMEPAVREKIEAAYRAVAAAKTLPPADAAASFGESGRTFLRYALPHAALPCLENAAALAPRDYRWEYFAGFAAKLKGDLDRAEVHFQRAVALKSPFPAGLVRLADVELQRAELEAAYRAYTAALAFPDTAAAAHFGLGRIALQRGDARQAAEHFEATLAAQPAASIVHSQLAIAYRRLGQGDKAAKEAAALGKDAVQFPDQLLEDLEEVNPTTGVRVAIAIRELQEARVALAKAAQDFREAASVDPKDVRIWLGLGQAQESLGDTGGAEQSYRRAVELDPENLVARLKLGTLLAQRGARGEGIEQLKLAVRLRPDSKEARFNLGNALAQEGRLAEAETEFAALVKMAPQDREARALLEQLRQDLGKQPPAKEAPPPPR